NDPNGVNAEAHFGLLRQDFSMKPAAVRMRNLMRLVDPAATAGTAAALDFTLQGDLTGVERVLLRRADGMFVLAVWQKARVYDEYARREIGVPARALTLRTAAPMAVGVGLTAQGPDAAPVSASTHSTSLTIPGDDVMVVQLRPTGAPAAPAPVDPPPATGGTDQAQPEVPVQPQPTPAPAPAPRPSIQEGWRRAIANLKRRLGLRSTAQAASVKGAKRRAAAKRKQAAAKRKKAAAAR
ncbi:MAG: hypothetical protein ACSLFR_01905, partial [Solirubrobacteraceae bacterium]